MGPWVWALARYALILVTRKCVISTNLDLCRNTSSQVLLTPRLFVVGCELPSSPQLGKTQHQGQSHDDLPCHILPLRLIFRSK